MSHADDQSWLNVKQRREIEQVAQRDNLNFALPPESIDEITRCAGKVVSLACFIESSDWNYAALDIVDRREIKSFSIEDFWRYIGESEVPLEEPDHLSPVTVAKMIAHGVDLVGIFIEGNLSNLRLFSAEDFPASVIHWALQVDSADLELPKEVDFYLHFQMLMKHPVVGAGVRLAAWHRYRLPHSV
jgi:hypothetical protein